MNDLEINIKDNLSEFKPGDKIAGEVSWNLQSPPKSISLRLFWYTAGKGTEDIEIFEDISFDDPSDFDRRNFSFKTPEAPYSFSGSLISLCRALELVATKTETVRKDIVIAPDGEVVKI